MTSSSEWRFRMMLETFSNSVKNVIKLQFPFGKLPDKLTNRLNERPFNVALRTVVAVTNYRIKLNNYFNSLNRTRG